MMTDPKFPNGIFFNKRHENAPDFIRGSIGFSVRDAVQWLQENVDHDGRVKLDIKVSQAGKTYLAKNDFVPKRQDAGHDQPNQDAAYDQPNDEIPF